MREVVSNDSTTGGVSLTHASRAVARKQPGTCRVRTMPLAHYQMCVS